MHVQTVEDVMQPFMHYPKIIQQAVLRVETHPSFSSLTRSHKIVLKWLVARARASNAYEPIMARLDAISEQASVSYKTVQRAMLALNDIDWVVRITDGRGEFGVFAANHYRLTDKLCQLIGLPYTDTTRDPATNPKPASAVPAQAQAIPKLPTPILAAPMATPLTTPFQGNMDAATELQQFYERSMEKDRKDASSQQRDHSRADLPAELREITAFGVNEFGVCRLRGHAYARGHKLEHIWAIAKARLQELGAKGGRVYRYLIAMIVKDTDYAARASQETRIAAEKPQAVIPVSKSVLHSREVADQVVQQAIAGLPRGRAANINTMLALLGKGRGNPTPELSHASNPAAHTTGTPDTAATDDKPQFQNRGDKTDPSDMHQLHSQPQQPSQQPWQQQGQQPPFIETAVGHKCPTVLYTDV